MREREEQKAQRTSRRAARKRRRKRATRHAETERQKKVDAEKEAKFKESDCQAARGNSSRSKRKAKTDDAQIEQTQAQRGPRFQKAASDQHIEDMKAAYDGERADIASAGKKQLDATEQSKQAWEAAKDPAELTAKAKNLDLQHEVAMKELAKIEDAGARATAENSENLDYATKKLDLAHEGQAALAKATQEMNARDAAANDQYKLDTEAAATKRAAALKAAEDAQAAKLAASKQETAKEIADHAAAVKAQQGQAKTDADTEKTNADNEAKGKQGESRYKKGDEAAAEKNHELDEKWNDAMKEGRAKSAEYMKASQEAIEAKQKYGTWRQRRRARKGISRAQGGVQTEQVLRRQAGRRRRRRARRRRAARAAAASEVAWLRQGQRRGQIVKAGAVTRLPRSAGLSTRSSSGEEEDRAEPRRACRPRRTRSRSSVPAVAKGDKVKIAQLDAQAKAGTGSVERTPKRAERRRHRTRRSSNQEPSASALIASSAWPTSTALTIPLGAFEHLPWIGAAGRTRSSRWRTGRAEPCTRRSAWSRPASARPPSDSASRRSRRGFQGRPRQGTPRGHQGAGGRTACARRQHRCARWAPSAPRATRRRQPPPPGRGRQRRGAAYTMAAKQELKTNINWRERLKGWAVTLWACGSGAQAKLRRSR